MRLYRCRHNGTGFSPLLFPEIVCKITNVHKFGTFCVRVSMAESDGSGSGGRRGEGVRPGGGGAGGRGREGVSGEGRGGGARVF